MSKTSFIALLLLIVACGENKKVERPVSPRIKKETRIASPKQNSRIVRGESIAFEIDPKDAIVDSIMVEEEGYQETFTNVSFTFSRRSQKVGARRIKAIVYFEGKKETHYAKVIVLAENPPEELTYELVATYPHGENDYTQGLLIADGFLYESTGQTGESALMKKNLTTGEVVQQVNLSDDLFGEGLALVGDKFYQLTYTSGACLVYDKNLEQIQTHSYQGQGWGLETFDGNLLMTSSTEKIEIREPINFTVVDQLEAYDNTGKVPDINELEMIDGLLYANVYQEDYIVAIEPSTGAVVKKIDMSGLLSREEARNSDVLNGIAYDQKTDRIFVTGKLWPKLFEVKFVPKQSVQ